MCVLVFHVAFPPFTIQRGVAGAINFSHATRSDGREDVIGVSRIRVVFPIIRELYRGLNETRLFDDVSLEERLAQDFLFPLQEAGTTAIPLTVTITLDDFFRIWRVLKFISLVDIEVNRPYSVSNNTAFLSSLVRVSKERELVEVISALGVDAAKAQEFLQLVGAEVAHLGQYDIQYRPFLRIAQVEIPSADRAQPREIIHLPTVVATSNRAPGAEVSNQNVWLPRNAVLQLFLSIFLHISGRPGWMRTRGTH